MGKSVKRGRKEKYTPQKSFNAFIDFSPSDLDLLRLFRDSHEFRVSLKFDNDPAGI